jgi:F420-dependent methylenetetrahydromethanopterin dehydrogenase
LFRTDTPHVILLFDSSITFFLATQTAIKMKEKQHQVTLVGCVLEDKRETASEVVATSHFPHLWPHHIHARQQCMMERARNNKKSKRTHTKQKKKITAASYHNALRTAAEIALNNSRR